MIDVDRMMEDAGIGDDAYRRLMRVMVAELEPAVREYASAFVDVLGTARRVWDGAGPTDSVQLLDSKITCWTYLDEKHGNSTTIADPEDRVLRALLCVLEPESDSADMSDGVEWFAAMLNGIDPARET
jgi:hypothetical protein